MKKDLPKIKRGLKEFILDEDAKVIDKTASKIAITISFMAINFIANSHDANAKNHKNHANHHNDVNADDYMPDYKYHAGVNPTQQTLDSITPKSVATIHGNHYNHQNADGNGMGAWLGRFILLPLGPLGSYIGDEIEQHFGRDDYDDQAISSGEPYHISEEILKILEEEEN